MSNYTRILHTIQAELLLAMYFFRTNRFMEADIHLNGAVSLCLSCGLHKLRSCRPSYSTVLGVSSGREIHFPPPRDPVEEGERINAFWTVFYVHRLMTVSLGTASPPFGTLDDPESQVDSPWPLEMEQYEQGHDLTFTNYRTIDNFLATGAFDQGQSSVVAFHVKSAILLHRAFCLFKKHKHGLKATELDRFISECTSLDLVITQFLGGIPLINVGDNPSISRQTQCHLTVAYALSSCAYMKIQSIFSRCGIADSQRRACQTADSIIQTIRDLDPLYLCPMMVIVCLASCRTLVEELERMQSKSIESFSHFGYQEAESTSQQDDASWQGFLGAALARGVDTMSTMAVDCPLAMYQLERFQRAYNYKLG
uniref:Transcription factor domain-containing protein n=1 Tax=Moniliophthora roreri TaxID=221103 RepID=A0A0W0EY39_MONRR